MGIKNVKQRELCYGQAGVAKMVPPCLKQMQLEKGERHIQCVESLCPHKDCTWGAVIGYDKEFEKYRVKEVTSRHVNHPLLKSMVEHVVQKEQELSLHKKLLYLYLQELGEQFRTPVWDLLTCSRGGITNMKLIVGHTSRQGMRFLVTVLLL